MVSQSASLGVETHLGLMTRYLLFFDSYGLLFYCLKFETSLFVASYDSQGHGGGIRPRLHSGAPELLKTDKKKKT
jgi:hypothetical protein